MDAAQWQRLKPCLELYPIDVIRVHPVAPGRFRVDTSRRSYEARWVPQASATMRRSLGDYLAHRAFRTTQRFLLNLYHDRVVTLEDDQVFYLTDAWYAPALQVTHEDVRLAVQNLASLHKAMDGYTATKDWPAGNVKKRYGTWEKTLEQGAQWIATERVLARSKRQTQQEMAWYDWLSRWEEQAHQALRTLRDAGYRELAETSRKNAEMAWNDYRLGNLVRRTAGKVSTLQTQDPACDSSIYDLATVCKEVCAAGHADGVEEAITQYGEARTLSPEQRQVIRGFAAYPHQALTTIRKVRMERDHDRDEANWQTAAERQWSAAGTLLSRRL